RSGELSIAKPSAAAFRDQKASSVFSKVFDQVSSQSVKDLRAHRHSDYRIGAFTSRALRTFTMHATPGNMLGVVTQVKQRIQRAISYDPNIAAATAITARRAAARNELLSPKSGNAISSMSPLDANF